MTYGDHYEYGEYADGQPDIEILDDGITLRRKKGSLLGLNRKIIKKQWKPLEIESDYYGYTDNNVGEIMDNDFSPTPIASIDQMGVFRKHNKTNAKLVRKPVKKIKKKTVKKCKCK
jgi:hypothetical protein